MAKPNAKSSFPGQLEFWYHKRATTGKEGHNSNKVDLWVILICINYFHPVRSVLKVWILAHWRAIWDHILLTDLDRMHWTTAVLAHRQNQKPIENEIIKTLKIGSQNQVTRYESHKKVFCISIYSSKWQSPKTIESHRKILRSMKLSQ